MTGSGRSGPTIVLIGGDMTVDDGTRLDSRQQLEADHRSEVMLRTLSTSLLWWQTTASLVAQILASAGADRPALVVSGTRSVVELEEDGTHRLTRLSGLLPGGATTTEFIRAVGDDALPAGYQKAAVPRDWIDDHYIATIGWKPGKPGKRWHFLKYDFYLPHCIPVLALTAVFIDASVNMFEGNFRTERGPDGAARIHGAVGHRFRAFEQSRLYREDAVLILPHTSANETFLARYSDWVAAGRPSTASETEDYSWMRRAYDLAAESGGSAISVPDLMERTLPTPIEAGFGVTGLMEAAHWQDASHLEASRALLQARYDLKIGIWDLARNPILRKTLLDATPIATAPATLAAVPAAAQRRAADRVNKTLTKRDNAQETWIGILAHFGPLTRLGWVAHAEPTRGQKWHLYLPLTRPYVDYMQPEPGPLAQLHMSFSKRNNAVELTARQRGLVGLEPFLHTHPEAFQWTEDSGWGDEIDWTAWATAMTARTLQWLKIFAPMREVYERLNDNTPPPAVLADLPALWQRPDGGVSITTPLRGIEHAHAGECVAALQVGDPLVLRRDPQNLEDPNAIAVRTKDGQPLGYLAPQVSRLLAPLVDRPSPVELRATLASRPQPNPPEAAHRRWDPILRYDQVALALTSDPGSPSKK